MSELRHRGIAIARHVKRDERRGITGRGLRFRDAVRARLARRLLLSLEEISEEEAE
jgi:hypothetical protein